MVCGFRRGCLLRERQRVPSRRIHSGGVAKGKKKMEKSKGLYKVVFDGRIGAQQNLKVVKQKLGALLKKDPQQIDRLFSGKVMVVVRSVDAATAEKYRCAFESAGALCRIIPLDEDPAGPQPREASSDVPPAATLQVKNHYFAMDQNGDKMIVTNIENVPGKTIVEHFGLVSGSTIRAKHIGRDLMAGLKNIVGGELKGYTQLLRESRRQAVDRMIEQAKQLGANAIINIRFSTSSVAQGAAELYAYGTAVMVR